MFRDLLVEGALIYVGVVTFLLALLFLIVQVVDRRVREAAGDATDAAAAVCQFTPEEWARLIHYRNAVRAGYYTDELDEPGSSYENGGPARQAA